MPHEIIQTEHGSKIGDVEFIWARNSKEFLFANSIYIQGSPSIIVDPSATFTYIEELAMSQSVNMVLNTHYHADHRSLNGLFNNVIFASHEADAAAIRDHATYEEFADSDPNSFYSQWRKQFFQKYHISDCPVSQLYKGNELIETDTTQIQLVHIPGHTPGHMALHFKNISTIFISDIDLTPYGPWYANVVSDIEEFKKSVEKVMAIEADYYVTSHGERIYDREKFLEKIKRFHAYFDDRDSKIMDLLNDGPKDLATIASHGIIYRKMLLQDPLKAYFEWLMVEKHLNRLVLNNHLIKDGDLYYIKS
ncbi:MBL fold metallo-hydrolase [bacterium]|nr:MBL fold metallo-hydrolase [bacterium]